MEATNKTASSFSVKSFLQKYTMLIALVLIFILFNILTGGRMLYPQNISNLVLQNAYVLVLASGMLMSILTGGNIDLSVGSVMCLVGAIAAKLLQATPLPPLVVIIIGLAASLAIGMWQGFWIGYMRIPPFITTLAGMFLWRGIGRVILASKTIAIQNKAFLNIFTSYINLGALDETKHWSALIIGGIVVLIYIFMTLNSAAKSRKLGYSAGMGTFDWVKMLLIAAVILWYCWKLTNYKGIPVMLIWILAVVLTYGYVTSRTVLGRHFYAVGGNEKATQLSGIDTNRIYFIAYTSLGVLAGLSGLLVGSRLGAVNGDTGQSYEMDAIASCFIGGASAYGGIGKVSGMIIGAVLMGVINQGMNMVGVDSNLQRVVKGLVLLAAVIFDVMSKRQKR